jgi:hypothetical protein
MGTRIPWEWGEAAPYGALFRAEKDDIGPENAYFWDVKTE